PELHRETRCAQKSRAEPSSSVRDSFRAASVWFPKHFRGRSTEWDRLSRKTRPTAPGPRELPVKSASRTESLRGSRREARAAERRAALREVRRGGEPWPPDETENLLPRKRSADSRGRRKEIRSENFGAAATRRSIVCSARLAAVPRPIGASLAKVPGGFFGI